jgi:hypothetical protein
MDLMPVIKNLNIYPSFNKINVEYELVSDNSESVTIAYAHNLIVKDILGDMENSFSVTDVDEGFNDIVFETLLEKYIPEFIITPYGRRFLLKWDTVEDIDLEKYVIERSVNQSTWTNIGESLTPVILERNKIMNNGTNVFLTGIYNGDFVNDYLNIEVNNDLSVTATFRGREFNVTPLAIPVHITDGIEVSFSDLDLEAGEVSFKIGIRNYFLTPELPVGYNYFRIKSVDKFGGESPWSSTKSVYVVKRPNPISDLVLANTDEEITLTWKNNDGYDAIFVYSNYNLTTEQLDPYVDLESPIDILGPDDTSWTFNKNGLTDKALFYVRGYKNGIDDNNYLLMSHDTITNVPSNIMINNPELFSIKQISGGRLKVTYNYNWTDGEDHNRALIYMSTLPPDQEETPHLVFEVPLGSGVEKIDLIIEEDEIIESTDFYVALRLGHYDGVENLWLTKAEDPILVNYKTINPSAPDNLRGVN